MFRLSDRVPTNIDFYIKDTRNVDIHELAEEGDSDVFTRFDSLCSSPALCLRLYEVFMENNLVFYTLANSISPYGIKMQETANYRQHLLGGHTHRLQHLPAHQLFHRDQP